MPSKATAPQDAGAEASKRAGPKVSTKLMGLKFMQRAKAKKDMSIQAKAAKKALEEVCHNTAVISTRVLHRTVTEFHCRSTSKLR